MANLLEELRAEMIQAFHFYVEIAQDKIGKRMRAWEFYCEKREKFLEQDSYRNGRRYQPLKVTLIDAEN